MGGPRPDGLRRRISVSVCMVLRIPNLFPIQIRPNVTFFRRTLRKSRPARWFGVSRVYVGEANQDTFCYTGTLPARWAFLAVVGHVNSGRRISGLPGNSLMAAFWVPLRRDLGVCLRGIEARVVLTSRHLWGLWMPGLWLEFHHRLLGVCPA
jgi:hypothetical protein